MTDQSPISTRWCPYCQQQTPLQLVVVLIACTDRECAATGHHVHSASRTEDVCGTCQLPHKITITRKDQP